MQSGGRSYRSTLVALAAVVWLALSGFALYQLQTADQRLFDPQVLAGNDPFSQQHATFTLQALTQDIPGPLLLHAWDPSCPCGAASLEHLYATADLLREKGVSVLVLALPDHLASAQRIARKLAETDGLDSFARVMPPDQAVLPATPAAAVLDNQHRLVYMGPWSSGGACVSGIGGFVESALLALDTDNPISVINRAAVGCYCDWANTTYHASSLQE